MAWASPSDVRDDWIGDPLTATDSQIRGWLGKAERMVIRRVPGIEARLLSGRLSMDTARDVVVAMVTRVLQNPTGARQFSTTTGPGSAAVTYGGDNPGELLITDDEMADLSVGLRPKRAFTIHTAPGML